MGYVEQKNHLFPCKIVKVQSVENWKEMLKIDVKDAIFFFFFRRRVKGRRISVRKGTELEL